MESRRHAVLLIDLCGSTRYFDTHGEIAGRRLVERCLQVVIPEVERHAGRVVKTLGDGLMAAFSTAAELVEAARAAHAAVDADNQRRSGETSIRIHSGGDVGPVVADDHGDLFGDVVNVATRVQEIAGPDQIYVTARIVADLPNALRQLIRAIGSFPLRGVGGEVEIHEAIWRFEGSTLVVPRRILPIETHLSLVFDGRTYELPPGSAHLTLGRTPDNDVPIDDGAVSREHAALTRRRGLVILIDRSTNGTYLRPEHGEPRHLHRGEALLEGRGSFSLGRADGPAVEYTVTRLGT